MKLAHYNTSETQMCRVFLAHVTSLVSAIALACMPASACAILCHMTFTILHVSMQLKSENSFCECVYAENIYDVSLRETRFSLI